MGGGDLNLKKSWHPQTMKNQEKVWKAEQVKSQEEKKLKDLRREIEEEKTREELKQIGRNSGILPQEDKKLEWMYKNSTELINREEYLLGRTIDKSFEILQAEEQKKEQSKVGVKQSINHVEHECIPFSIRAYRNLESTEQVDLQRKVMEDPLMLIKQRELESRRKILENPVKLKELHRILKTEGLLKKTKKVKKAKKSKKSHKKNKKRSSSSTYDYSDSNSDSDTGKDLDKELAKRYKQLNEKEDLAGLNLAKLLDAKFETITKELDKAANRKRNSNKIRRSASSSSQSDRSYKERNSWNDRKRISRATGHETSRKELKCRRSRTRSPLQYRCHRRSSKEPRRPHNSSSPRKKENAKEGVKLQKYSRPQYRSSNEYQRMRRKPSRSPDHLNRCQRSRSPRKQTHSPRRQDPATTSRNRNETNFRSTRPTDSKPRTAHKKLSDAEKGALLNEMMQNASWREEDRIKAVKKHRDDYAREEAQYRTHDFDKEFINKEVKKVIANQSSVGSRIRSNLNNIQRTSAAMDSNFARK